MISQPIELAGIPAEAYSDYRYELIFRAYKWDPQVEDNSTVSKEALLVSKETARQLSAWAERLYGETILMEEALIDRPDLAKKLGLPRKILKHLPRLKGYKRDRHVRLMRFDFHPIQNGGWAVSEVNSDVPGGLAEASVWGGIAAKYFPGTEPGQNVAEKLFGEFHSKTKDAARVALVHATSYSDDRQVMQFIGDYFSDKGLAAVYAAPDHVQWRRRKARITVNENEAELDGILRFFPLEWFPNLPSHSRWENYFDCETVSCNHPVSLLTQSKRLPLIWDDLGADVPIWKELLPETRSPREVSGNDWIYKPVLGRVGEGISIKSAVSQDVMLKIKKDALRYPEEWIAQRQFESLPLFSAGGHCYHLCIGVFTVNYQAAGFYGRISLYPRIDKRAQDIPVLVRKGD
jgi:glutathionylspermidine synthase